MLCLNDDCIYLIFKKLDSKAITNCNNVCNRFRHIILHYHLSRKLNAYKFNLIAHSYLPVISPSQLKHADKIKIKLIWKDKIYVVTKTVKNACDETANIGLVQSKELKNMIVSFISQDFPETINPDRSVVNMSVINDTRNKYNCLLEFSLRPVNIKHQTSIVTALVYIPINHIIKYR